MNHLAFSNKELAAGLVPELFVRNLAVSLRFYTSFGFKIVRQSGGEALLGWDKSLLLLHEMDTPPAGPALRSSIRIVVPDVDDYYLYALRERLPVPERIGNRPNGLRDFTVGDPDGFGLRFATPAGPPDTQAAWLEKVIKSL